MLKTCRYYRIFKTFCQNRETAIDTCKKLKILADKEVDKSEKASTSYNRIWKVFPTQLQRNDYNPYDYSDLRFP